MFEFEVSATDGPARAGLITTPRGTVKTPVFMPVGTRAAVRLLTAADLEQLDSEIILGNTYHLMLRPGADLIEDMGGLHRFEDWGGLILTDSGGYQIFSLSPKVDDEGATFTSTYDGSKHKLTPEGAVEVQTRLGADIQMVLDICPALPATPEALRSAVDRTADWAERARSAFLARPERGDGMRAQFGIVQGGLDLDLRRESAERTVGVTAAGEQGFEGYAIGGLSVGEDRADMLDPMAATCEVLPADKPRYLMGVGDPLSLIEGVSVGVDMFDCVLPTRLARHGTVFTSEGRLNISNARFARDDSPIDPGFPASPVARFSRGYVRHLLQVNEPSGARILTMHNLAWTLDLMRRARAAVEAGTISVLLDEVRGQAEEPGFPLASAAMSLIIMIAMFAVLWAVLLLPQQRKMKAHRQLIASLEVGDEVLLTSGIYGQIADFDGQSMFIAVSDNLEIKVTRESVAERVVYSDDEALQDSVE